MGKNRNRSLSAALLLLTCGLGLAVATPTAIAQRPVVADDFERSRGKLARELEGNERLEVVRSRGTGGSKALEATYEGSDRGSERIVEDVRLRRPGDEFTLCYDVKFAEDFDFARGGKLPGLGPDDPVAGGDPVRPDGWSVRLMWRQEGAVISYIYHQDQKGKFGDAKKSSAAFERGKYHAVTLQVKINSAGDKADGEVAIYIDGEKQIEHSSLRLRGTDGKEAIISKFLFATFHGGSSPDWAPRDEDGNFSTEKAWFDNIAIYEGKVVRPSPGAESVAAEPAP